jgi:DNA-binding CsgD family transcriptional regulator
LTGSPSIHALVLAQGAYVHAHRGDIAETRRVCDEATELVQHFGYALPTIWIAASLALLELSLEDFRATWQAGKPLTEAIEKQGIGEPATAFFLPDVLEALIGLGELDRAEALIDSFEGRARALDRSWALATGARCRGLLLAARGEFAGAEAALERALVEHERMEMPFEFGRTLFVKGLIERRMRRRARAKESFARALEIFERLPARLWAERTRQELGRTGIRRSSGNELTAGERRVAELAARGLTNREVAVTLFISPKTVEANLSRVYRKLGITSRAQLGARMSEPVQK